MEAHENDVNEDTDEGNDIAVDVDLAGESDIEEESTDDSVKKEEQRSTKEERSMADVKARLRKHSIQLPVRSSDYSGLSSGKQSQGNSSLSIPEGVEKTEYN